MLRTVHFVSLPVVFAPTVSNVPLVTPTLRAAFQVLLQPNAQFLQSRYYGQSLSIRAKDANTHSPLPLDLGGGGK